MRFIVTYRNIGRIHEENGFFHETRFACLTLLQLPFLPTATYRYREGSKDPVEKLPLSGRSIARAYLTTWSFVLALAVLFVGPRMMLANATFVSDKWQLVGLLLGVELVGLGLGFAGMTALFWMGRSNRWSTGGRIVRWLSSSFALFLVEMVVAAFGVRGLFA